MRPAYLPHLCMLGAVALLSGCGGSNDSDRAMNRADHDAMPTAPRPAVPDPGAQAQVRLMATQGNAVGGQLLLTMVGDGVRMNGEVTGLPSQGEFAIHVHEVGDCSAPDAESAGEHFNPGGHPHGHPRDDARHAGDLPNLRANDRGTAQVEMVNNQVSLGDGGSNDIMGKSVVVHAQPDDYTTQPAGGSGDRLACGVIAAG